MCKCPINNNSTYYPNDIGKLYFPLHPGQYKSEDSASSSVRTAINTLGITPINGQSRNQLIGGTDAIRIWEHLEKRYKGSKKNTVNSQIAIEDVTNKKDSSKWTVTFHGERDADTVDALDEIRESSGFNSKIEAIRFLVNYYQNTQNSINSESVSIGNEQVKDIEKRLQKQIDDMKKCLLMIGRQYEQAASIISGNCERIFL